MKAKDLIKGNQYDYLLKFPTDKFMIYQSSEEIYTYFDHEIKYIFKVYQNDLGIKLIGNKYRLVYLSEGMVNNYVT